MIMPGMSPDFPQGGLKFEKETEMELEGVTFLAQPDAREYDWLVVYDDMPRRDVGSIIREKEELACPSDQTILITAEPPTIKLYPGCYTRQFGYVLTTHDEKYLPHRNRRICNGSMQWIVDYTAEQVFSLPNWEKSKLISTCCSTKQMKHTRHFERLKLTNYLSEHLPEMDWYGHGKRFIESKQTSLNSYKYHVAVENYIHPHHWSDKISDSILAQCLTFYAGDPKLTEVLPEGSFIPIPIDDPPQALEIIQRAIRNNEYEKRLPLIREAQRLIATRYNMFAQVLDIIRGHKASSTPVRRGKRYLLGRQRLRCNPVNALEELALLAHYRVFDRAC